MQPTKTGTNAQMLENPTPRHRITLISAIFTPFEWDFYRNGLSIFYQARIANSYSTYCITKFPQAQVFQPHFFHLNRPEAGCAPAKSGRARRPAPLTHLMNLSSSRMTSRTSMGLATWAFMPQSRLRFTSSAKASAVMAIMGRSRSSRSRVRITWVAS